MESNIIINRKSLNSFRSSLRNRSTSAEADSWDGAPHAEYHKIQEDENRDKFLENFGFTVLRFENRFIFQEPEYLISDISTLSILKENGSEKPINHPGRNKLLQYFGYHCDAATPPSKANLYTHLLC